MQALDRGIRLTAAAGVVLLGLLLTAGTAGAAPAGKIVFNSTLAGDREIVVINADGSGRTPLTDNAFNDHDPSWSPNGRLIAFRSDRGTTGDDVWVMNADGSGQRQLTSLEADEFSIDWAPNGRQLIFSRDVGPAQTIWRINLDGTGLVPVTNLPTDVGAYGGHYSPDGTKIVFTRDNGTDALHLMNPDGSGLRPLTSFDGYAPDFTANGKRVVFWSNDDPLGTNPEEDPEIFSIAVDGTGLRQLTDSGAGIAGDDIASSPSRDGLDRIAWVSRRDDDNNREIFRMKADGSGVVQLTFDAAGVENRGPDWQPTARCGGRVATIVGTRASEVLRGGPGPDVIAGQGGRDRILGRGARDIACGQAGPDRLLGGRGRDLLLGGLGGDRLLGGAGGDRLLGGKGPDRLLGGPGRDRLLGGFGRDRLFGGKGRDRLIGGKGRDRQRQ